LLADAYAEQRFMDLRVAGAAFAPKTVVRGVSGQPASLLEAKAAIDLHLSGHQNDAPWLHAAGLAELLSGRNTAAMNSLLRASQIAPDSADIRIDLAVALAQRGLGEGGPHDLESAETILSRALALQADNPAALFNRALVRENRQEWDSAERDWQRYLILDPGSGWAREAKQHLERIRSVRQ
jgi:Flp pilus assembly protein TadD